MTQLKKKAVAYYRSASENEEWIQQQQEHVRGFALRNGIEIIHEEMDNGASGLTLQRPGLQRLLREWILDHEKSFDYVLAYDVVRLARDSDLATYFEWQCARQGKPVLFAVDAALVETCQHRDRILT